MPLNDHLALVHSCYKAAVMALATALCSSLKF